MSSTKTIIRKDIRLSAEQLRAKYDPDFSCEANHPLVSLADWQHAVAQGHTLTSYWQWVEIKLSDMVV